MQSVFLWMNVKTHSISCEHFENAVLAQFIDSQELRGAMGLLESGAVLVESLREDGCIQGLIKSGPNWLRCQARLLPDGRLALPQRNDEAHPEPRGAQGHAPALSLALWILWQLRATRKGSEVKNLLRSGPDWLDSHYRLDIQVVGWKTASHELQWPEHMASMEDLQAYWELMSTARGARQPIPAETLVRHVFKLYGQSPWSMKRAALENLLKRIASSSKEELELCEKPKGKAVLGQYAVRRKSGGQRPYTVLLFSNSGIGASCSCKDFQKNELGFCKHIATVLLHWHSTDETIKRYTKELPPLSPRMAWSIELGLDRVVDPLETIELQRVEKNSEALRQWKTYFDPKTLQLALPSEPEARLKSLKKFLVALENDEARLLFVDPVVLPLVKKAIADLLWPVRYPKELETFHKTIDGMNYKLYPYQQEGVLTALSRGKFLLGDDMGLGKTVQAITWAECLFKAKVAKVIIVICPAGLKTQWQREWGQISGRQCRVVVGTPGDRQACYASARSEGQTEVLLINYELVSRDLDHLLTLAPDAVILDEAQRIKNYATQTAMTVKALTPPFRLILTGTPMENRIQELSSLMDWIDDHAMGPLWRLDSETRLGGDGDGHGHRGVKGLNIIRERLAPHFLRRLRSKVLGDLPSRTDSILMVPFTEAQSGIHDDLGARVARLMAIAAQRPLKPHEHLMLMSLLTQMRIVSNALAQYEYENIWESLKHDPQPELRLPKLDSPKLQSFRDLIGGLLPQEGVKIVVFSQWQRMLRLAEWSIQDHLTNHDCEAVFFTGRESSRRRTENIVRFHDDPEVRIFFATDAGGVGLNLQKAATICINMELPWNPAVLEQRIGRLHRLGQKQPVQVFNLITERSIEERISSLVGQKRAVFSELFDGTGDEVIYEKSSSFYEQVKIVVQDLGARKEYGTMESPVVEELELEMAEAELSSEVKVLSDEIEMAPEEGATASENVAVVSENAEIVSENATASEAVSANNPLTLKPVAGENQPHVVPEPIPASNPAAATGGQHAGPVVSTESLAKAFQEVKMERTSQGTLRIEASGESAKLLAGLFRGMAEMFESAK